MQVLSGEIDPSNRMSSWTDPDNGNTYHNIIAVGAVSRGCSLSINGLASGDMFTFQLDPNPKEIVCISCAVTSPNSVPPASNSVKNITK